MNSCSRSDDVLRYLMGDLDPDERDLFERHLEGCPSCRNELRLERALQNGLAECTLPEAAPAELRPGVLTGILTVRRPRFPWWQIGITVAAGAAAILALIHVLGGSEVPGRGLRVLTGAMETVSSLFSAPGSILVTIGAGIVLVGVASLVASLVPED